MVRTIVYLFVAVDVLATIATPVATHGRSIDAVVHTRQSHLLGPGGPDDSFPASALDDDAPETASQGHGG